MRLAVLKYAFALLVLAVFSLAPLLITEAGAKEGVAKASTIKPFSNVSAEEQSVCPQEWLLHERHGGGHDDSFRSIARPAQAPDTLLLEKKYLKMGNVVPGVFDAGGGIDVLEAGGTGFVNVDGKHVIGIEIFKMDNGQANIVNVLASGLSTFDEAHGVIFGDKKKDIVYLDGCLNWEGPKPTDELGGLLRYLAKDKQGRTASIDVANGVDVRVLSPKRINEWAQSSTKSGVTLTGQNNSIDILSQDLAKPLHESLKNNDSDNIALTTVNSIEDIPSPLGKQRIAGWGQNRAGELGVPGQIWPAISAPVWAEAVERILEPDFHVLQISMGNYSSCLLRSDLTVWCWGGGNTNQPDASAINPLQVKNLPPIKAIKVGNGYKPCAYGINGEILCWGRNIFDARPYQPDWLSDHPDDPDLTKLSQSFTDLDIGVHDSCAITKSGTVWCWGLAYSNDGEVHRGLQKNQTVYPISIPLTLPAVHVNAGFYTSCALLNDQTERCWENKLKPAPSRIFGTNENVKQIFAGWDGWCALKSNDGSVWCWRNDYNSAREAKVKPVEFSQGLILRGILNISTGNVTGCGIDKEESLWCWGAEARGNSEDLAYPYAVNVKFPNSDSSISHVKSVTAGDHSVLAILDLPKEETAAIDPSIAFMSAVQSANFDRADELYKQNKNVHVVGKLSELALVSAALSNRADLVKIILDTGFTEEMKERAGDLYLDAGSLPKNGNSKGYQKARVVGAEVIEELMNFGVKLYSPTRSDINVKDLLVKAFESDASASHLLQRIKEYSETESKSIDSSIAISSIEKKNKDHLVEYKWQKNCDFDDNSAESIFEFFPVVIEGEFIKTGEFQTSKVYKGFRKQTIKFPPEDVKSSGAKVNHPLLVLAEFDGLNVRLGSCHKMFETSQVEMTPIAAKILAEAALYDAVLQIKQQPEAALEKESTSPLAGKDRLMRDNDSGQAFQIKYDDKTKLIRDKNDYLYLLEFSRAAIQDILQNRRQPINLESPMYERQLEQLARDKKPPPTLCSKSILISNNYLPPKYAEILSDVLVGNEYSSGLSSFYSYFGNAFVQAVYDFSYALIRSGNISEALPGICKFNWPSLYIMAASEMDFKELISGKKFERAQNLSNLDLSGVVLKGIQASGTEWRDVNVSGADFTAANFQGTKFKNVKLGEAKLFLASYSCQTVFPEGFDPVKHHLIEVDQWNCDKSKPPAALDLSNIEIKPFYPETNDYDNIVFTQITLQHVAAQSSKLGRVTCKECSIQDSDFSGTQVTLTLENGKVENTSFKQADLTNSYWSKTTFRNVDFSEANLSNITLLDSAYDAQTKWPVGFDPDKAGLHKIESENTK